MQPRTPNARFCCNLSISNADMTCGTIHRRTHPTYSGGTKITPHSLVYLLLLLPLPLLLRSSTEVEFTVRGDRRPEEPLTRQRRDDDDDDDARSGGRNEFYLECTD
ncbi:hypothetical protein ECG_09208 [Echinococcus granulosus]|nr:hypothetical protein ECG_09208 [Echinococcus granulosus]